MFKTRELNVHCVYENVCVELLLKVSVLRENKTVSGQKMKNIFLLRGKNGFKMLYNSSYNVVRWGRNENRAHGCQPEQRSDAAVLPVP